LNRSKSKRKNRDREKIDSTTKNVIDTMKAAGAAVVIRNLTLSIKRRVLRTTISMTTPHLKGAIGVREDQSSKLQVVEPSTCLREERHLPNRLDK